jgi:hypothetical protein
MSPWDFADVAQFTTGVEKFHFQPPAAKRVTLLK